MAPACDDHAGAADPRVIVPFTPNRMHPRTAADLQRYAPSDTELVDVSGSTTAYHELLASLWADGRAFTLVEHDMGLRAGVFDELAACPEPWCGFEYPIGDGYLVVALGLTRFSAVLLAATPDIPAALAAAEGHAGVPPRDWRALDARLDALLRTAGFVAHRHSPPVQHYHAY